MMISRKERSEQYDTVKWSCTVGINSGYELNDQKNMPVDEIAGIYLEIAEEIRQETGVYISAVISESRLLYSPEWGCPKEGEYSYTLSGSCNLNFSKPEPYLEALEKVMQKLKKRLKQKTLLVEIYPAKLNYYTE